MAKKTINLDDLSLELAQVLRHNRELIEDEARLKDLALVIYCRLSEAYHVGHAAGRKERDEEILNDMTGIVREALAARGEDDLAPAVKKRYIN